MGDFAKALLALAAVLAPLGLAWWLLRDRKRPGQRGRRDGSTRPPSRPASE